MRRAITAVAAALFLGACTSGGGAFREMSSQPCTPPPSAQGPVGLGRSLSELFDPQEPLLSPGHRTSLDAFESEVGFPPFRPEGPAPSQVWVAEGAREAGLRYGCELVLIYALWPPGTDVDTRVREQAESWQTGYFTQIAGNPAWVVPGNAGDSIDDPRINVVHVSIGRVEVTLFGLAPIEELVEKAASLHP